VAWLKFSVFFYSLANSNLGLVNLGLLILFFVAVVKMMPLNKMKRNFAKDIVNSSPFKYEIEQDMQVQDTGKKIVKDKSLKITKSEIHTIKDMAETLAEIQRIVETNQNQLSRPDREKIAAMLQKISKNEDILKKELLYIQSIFKQISAPDAKQVENLKKRLKKASKKNQRLLEVELEQAEKKLKIEKTIFDLEERLNQYMNSFNNFLQMAAELLGRPEHLSEVKDILGKARVVLKDINEVLSITESLEKNLVNLIEAEKKLLKKEKKSA
jgi:hypothetical protein